MSHSIFEILVVPVRKEGGRRAGVGGITFSESRGNDEIVNSNTEQQIHVPSRCAA